MLDERERESLYLSWFLREAMQGRERGLLDDATVTVSVQFEMGAERRLGEMVQKKKEPSARKQ